MADRWNRLVEQTGKVVRTAVESAGRRRDSAPSGGRSESGNPGGGNPRGGRTGGGEQDGPDRAGTDADLSGTDGIAVSYEPDHDGDADPGEVVWAWVPYEDDPGQGKDRPVLILGWDGPLLVGVPLSSKDHDGRRDEDDWVPVGTGAWDRQGRPSNADAARLLRIAPSEVRREGSALPRERFEAVLRRVEQIHDWTH